MIDWPLVALIASSPLWIAPMLILLAIAVYIVAIVGIGAAIVILTIWERIKRFFSPRSYWNSPLGGRPDAGFIKYSPNPPPPPNSRPERTK